MPEKNKFFKISRSIRDITPVARGQVLMGWGDADHRALEVREKINVRLVWCQDEKKESLLFFQFDICMMSAYLRERLLESLLSCESLQSFYLKRESFIFSATHTHAAPGGYCKEALYQLGSLGIDEDFILLLIQKTKECVVEASKKFIHGKIIYGDGIIPDSLSIFHNRSLDAFLENKEVKEGKLNASDSIPRNFPVLRCEDESGNPLAMLSFIGLHGTCIHQDTKCIHPDHKGLASRFSEEKYGSQSPGFIALYLQGAAGDLTPNFKRH